MAAYFEAVVVAANQSTLIRLLENLPASFAPFSLEMYRVAQRRFVVFGWRAVARRPSADDAIEELANVLSRKFGKAVAAHFDNMIQVRYGTLFRGGQLIRTFGEEDEVWIPIDGRGNPLPNAPRYPGNVVPEDVECDFVWDAIDAALEAAGFRSWLTADGLMDVAGRDDFLWQRPGKEEKRRTRH